MNTLTAKAVDTRISDLILAPPKRVAVAKFGVEHEMFPRSWRPTRLIDGFYDHDDDDDDDDGADAAADYVGQAARLGLCSPRLHDYHCGCDDCDCERDSDSPLMATQEDCTVGVEHVSRILNVNSTVDLDQLGQWIAFLQQWKDDGGWMPNGQATCGNHIHVEAPDIEVEHSRPNLVSTVVNAPYAAFDWEHVADGGCGRIRPYNHKPDPEPRRYGDDTYNLGSWFCRKYTNGGRTWEHRLWNSPSDPQRMWVHVGLSVAITRWAADAAEAIWLHDSETSLRLSDASSIVLGRRDEWVAAVIERLPSDPRFVIAGEVLASNLSVY